EHEAEFVERHHLEERRLCYVALTRSEQSLLVSGFWWNETSSKPKGPSELLTEIGEAIADPPTGRKIGTVAHWSPEPEPGPNPLVTAARELAWPVDPLGTRRDAVEEGAALVRDELAGLPAGPDGGADPVHSAPTDPVDPADDPDGWVADTDVLLRERARYGSHSDRV